jgi:hypothetical protein
VSPISALGRHRARSRTRSGLCPARLGLMSAPFHSNMSQRDLVVHLGPWRSGETSSKGIVDPPDLTSVLRISRLHDHDGSTARAFELRRHLDQLLREDAKLRAKRGIGRYLSQPQALRCLTS